MKKLPSFKAVILAIIATVSFLGYNAISENQKLAFSITTTVADSYSANEIELESIQVDVVPIDIEIEAIVYEGMTLTELSAKLDKNLSSTLSGYGSTFASLSIEYGVDPYVALAIVLLETGCNSGTCSYLTRVCNNVGGMKGSSGCNGGAYAKFSTLEEGIEAYILNLSTNYYQMGLTTVESIGSKYAESSTWAQKVYNYINQIQNS